MVSVAQLVERWIVAPVAVGSIPIAHPEGKVRTRALARVPGFLQFRRTLKLHGIQHLFGLLQFRPNRS